jgi:uncharacterized protein
VSAGATSPAELLRGALGGELRETHISCVVLAGDRAYKIKKPLLLPFLDYSTLERRRELCHEEVRLNRRLAPDVYRGVRAIVVEDGVARIEDERSPGAVEYAVEMRRYDERSTLANRLATGDAGDRELRGVGTRLAAFHGAARLPPRPGETVAALDAMLAENFASLRELLPGDAGIEAAAGLATAVLQGRRDELRRRAATGLVRDGHGDLRAEHVVLEHGIEIVDCVEFDPALREQDVGLDLAFLAMDVMRRDERLARVLLDAYRAAGGDPGDGRLVDFFAAQRALIRAKVGLMRAAQLDAAGAARRRADVDDLLALADRLGWRTRLGSPAIVCGAAASGKSTLAGLLQRHSGAAVVSTDVTRKQLLGIPPAERAPLSAYTPGVSGRTYAELGRRVRALVAAGEPVLVDGTFRFASDRAAFTAALGALAEPAIWIECRAPEHVRIARARARAQARGQASDAGPAEAAAQAEEWEPLDSAARIVVATDRAPAAVLAAVRSALERRLHRGLA